MAYSPNTQFNEDVAHTTADAGTEMLAVRKDTATALANADGDYIPLTTDSTGKLWVNASGAAVPVTDNSGSLTVDNAGTFATQVDGAALTSLQLIDDPVATLGTTTYTEASTKGNIVGAVRRDANTSLVDTTNEVAPLQVNATGELKVAQIQALPAGSNAIGKLAANDGVDIGDVTVNNASGASAVNIQDGGNSITVDNGGTFAVQSNIAAGATNIAKAEDVLSADADVGVPAMAVRKATPANTSGTDGDYEFLQMSAGRLWTSTTIDAALPAGTAAIGKLAANSGVDIGDVDVTTVGGQAPTYGAGAVAAGTQRITHASDDPVTTALQLIDDPVATLGTTTYTEASTKGNIVGAVRRDANTSLVDTTNEVAPLQVNATGELKVAQIQALPAGSAILGKVGIDQTTPGTTNLVALAANQSVNTAQINGVAPSMGVGATGTGVQRVVQANDAGKTLLSKGGSAASSGDNTLVTAGSNRLKVKGFSLTTTSTTAVTCIFQSGAGGTELWRVVLQAVSGASTGANLVTAAPDWLFATASATLLNLNLSSAQTVHWSVSYFDEA